MTDVDNTAAIFSDPSAGSGLDYAVHYGADADGGRIDKTEYTNGAATVTDTFNTKDTAKWTFAVSTTVPYTDGANFVARLEAAGTCQMTNRTAYALTSGESASVDFRVNISNTELYLMLENDPGLASHSRLAVVAAQNKLLVQTRLNGGAWGYPKDLVSRVITNTWYRLTLRVDDVNGFRLELREREACNLASTTCAAVYSQRMPAGKSWRFATAIYDSFVWLDNYVERADGVERTNYVGGVFEHNPATNRGTSYYAFGSGPVAMRVMTGVITASVVTWLHGDHLGSASLTTNASGQRVSELRYKPFGEPRWVWGVTATDKRFTGQEEQAGLGSLYDYHARMYSPVLGRFLSADTIVPQPRDPQQFNRYAYVRNSPLAHIDPSGHAIGDATYVWGYLDALLYRSGVGSGSGGGGGVGSAVAETLLDAASLTALIVDSQDDAKDMTTPPLDPGPVLPNNTAGDVPVIVPITSISCPLDPMPPALETYPVGAETGVVYTSVPLGEGQALQLAGPMASRGRGPGFGTPVVDSTNRLGRKFVDAEHITTAAKRGWTKELLDEVIEKGEVVRGLQSKSGENLKKFVRPDGHYILMKTSDGSILQTSNMAEGFWDEKTMTFVPAVPGITGP